MTSDRVIKGYADEPRGQVHYRRCGDGQPLLLLHQSPSSSTMFRKAYALLAQAGIQAIGVDTPGFGMSDVPPHVPSIEDYAQAIPPVLDHLKLDAAAMLGHHTGASIAVEVATRFP